MKTNWLKLTNKINSERLRIPDGWETREQVAESLQCDPSKVADMLKPGIASGDIERQSFPQWNELRRMVDHVVCYREAVKKTDAPAKGESTIEDRIAEKIRQNPGLSNANIAKKFHVMHKVNAATVQKVRETL